MKTNHLRRCIFRPYSKGKGPSFILDTFDLNRLHNGGPQSAIGYCLTTREHGKTTTLFEGEDFGCSPSDCIDSDACIESLMGFLTLRPGDTDADYFDAYTQAQTGFCENHAEALSCEILNRFKNL